MKYKLKEGKQLTDEDFTMKYWRIKELDKRKFLIEYSLDFNNVEYPTTDSDKIDEIFILFSNFSFIQWEKLELENTLWKFKEMNFDDYFEEDKEYNEIGNTMDYNHKEEEEEITWEDINKPFKELGITPRGFGEMLVENSPEKVEKRMDKLRKDCKFQSSQEFLSNHIAEREEEVIKTFIKENLQAVHEDGKPYKVEYIHTEGSWMWAVEQMKKGKKVKSMSCVVSMERATGNFFAGVSEKEELQRFYPCLADFEATDWEIFEENKFGDFEIDKYGNIFNFSDNTYVTMCKEDIDDLEKAIKIARELQK